MRMPNRRQSSELVERGMSVRWRLTVIYTAVTVASAAVLLAGIYVLVSLREERSSGLFFGDATPPPDGVTPPGEGNLLRTELMDAQLKAIDHTLRNLLLWSGVGLVVMAGVSFIVGWLVAGRALRPVHLITQRARQISADALDERLSVEGPRDELREMAETFDDLLDRVQETVASERRLVATMSHELRTPLANQRTALDVALANPDADAAELRRAGEIARAQAERAQRTIDSLLTLARVQAGATPPHDGPVALGAMTTAAVDRARSESTLTWEAEITPATVRGDHDLLELAVANLLRNASVHNHPAGWVRVEVHHDLDGVRLVVENSGPTLDPDTVESLVLPFRRGAADRTRTNRGTGLGLSIVQAVADHHAAALTLSALTEGGLRAQMFFPEPLVEVHGKGARMP